MTRYLGMFTRLGHGRPYVACDYLEVGGEGQKRHRFNTIASRVKWLPQSGRDIITGATMASYTITCDLAYWLCGGSLVIPWVLAQSGSEAWFVWGSIICLGNSARRDCIGTNPT